MLSVQVLPREQSIVVATAASLASLLSLEMALSFRKGVTASVARVERALTELTRSARERERERRERAREGGRRERAREGEREGGREREGGTEREGGCEGGRGAGREGGRGAGREGGRGAGRKGCREGCREEGVQGGREGGRERERMRGIGRVEEVRVCLVENERLLLV